MSKSEELLRLERDESCCYFHKHTGEDIVRQVADAAVARYADRCT